MHRALVFGATAEEYQRWRPGYPDDAIDFLAPEPPARVLDLAAGTGQLTGPLLRRGLCVDAVDRDPEMVQVLRREHPEALVQVGSADRLPFDSACFDAVVVGTAFHWFPFDAATAEIRRVLKPGGWLGLVYNLVRPITEWEVALVDVDPDRKGAEDGLPEPSWPFPSGAIETTSLSWDWDVSPEHFRNCLATHSAIIQMDEHERRARLDAAHSIVEHACEQRGTSTAPLHHEAFCIRWTPSTE